MPSFHTLLASSTPFLLLDSASARVQVGLFPGATDHARWADSNEESGIALFRCLEQLAVEPSAMRAFVFCEGPGSVLGVRTAAMAIRTWCALAPRLCFAYRSLSLVAEATGHTVISDARRESWHLAAPGAPLQRVTREELPVSTVTPAEFRAWSPLPANTGFVKYDVRDLILRVPDHELFAPVDAPDAFLHTDPNYVTWTPQIHRAP